MIQKCLPVLVGFIICMWPFPASAGETGSIEMMLPKEMAGRKIIYQRDGDELKEIAVDDEGIAKIEELQEGNYEIKISETEDYNFMPISVHIPCWSEEEEQMLYDITIIPKYSVKEQQPPQTFDSHQVMNYIYIGIISLIILVIMSCHNRFNCDTMTGKYSKNGGQNDGNDNDTENPCSSRRTGLSSPGSVD